MLNKALWLNQWGYTENTPEAETAWAEKLAFKPQRRSFQIISAGVDYACPITGKAITTKRAHEDNLKVHDCRVLEGGEKEYNQRRYAAEEAALDQKVEDTVEKEIESYSSDKKEQLHNELVNGGLDIVVERK